MFKCFLLLVLVNCKLSSGVPTLEVNANTGHHTISNDLYGFSFFDDIAFGKEIKIPFDRWGGNAVTRYNWKNDAMNHAADWFFENIPEENDHPENLPDGSRADKFIEKDRSMGAKTIITIPLIGWVPKDREKRCGFSVKKYGEQEKTDQWMADCGNGNYPNGTAITGNDPTDTSVKVNGTFAKEWVEHLVKKYGKASANGVPFYEMDNEYDIWQGTHRDIRPKPAGTDEILNLITEYGAAVKSVDPSAKVMGPVGSNYWAITSSGLDFHGNNNNQDKATHGNIDFAAWYLKTMKEYEDKHKTRLLDYLDYHYYPQAANVYSDSTDPAVLAVRLRSTRALWDPEYVDESWLKDVGTDFAKVQMIPRMKKLIDTYYPGTKIAITEFNWGGTKTLNGGLTQAEVLGIFGREGVDMAAWWGSGNSTEPWAFAYRMYRNYDGKGGQFGDTGVTAKSSDDQNLSIFASVRSSDKKLTIIVINKDPTNDYSTKVSITGHTHSGTGKVFTYSNASLTKIVESSATMSGNDITHKFPAYSITLFEV